MRVTIKDVGREAGVSFQTVSKALNGDPTISRETVERVERAAKKLGYVRSAAARSMTSSRSHLIGVFVPQLSSSFYHNVLQGIETEAFKGGYNTLLFIYEHQSLTDRIEEILSHNVDGVVVFEAESSARFVSAIIEHETPVVFVNSIDVPAGTSHVFLDNEFGIRLALEHLSKRGHTDIAFAMSSHVTSTERLRHGKMHARDLGQNLRVLSFPGDYSSEDVYREFDPRALPSGVSAILCASDYIALPILTRCHEAGIAVPSDLSVIGFDDLEFAKFLCPPLTTVEQPKEHFGVTIFQTLANVIAGNSAEIVKLYPKLIIRQSVSIHGSAPTGSDAQLLDAEV